MSFPSDYESLFQFEHARTENPDSLSGFVKHASTLRNPEIQFLGISLDIETRLMIGDSVSVDDFLPDYEHLADELPRLIDEIKWDLFKTYCPVRSDIGQKDAGSFPQEFGDYLVLEELGRGGMGIVYRALHCKTDKEVALKVLFLNRDFIEKEAKLLARLDHNNVCGFVESGKVRHLPYLAFDLVEGPSLKHELTKVNKFSPKAAAKIILDIANGLEHAHEQGVVHFDIKCSNIMFHSGYDPVITDFGLAADITADDFHNSVDLSGSLPYLAPEFVDSRFGARGVASDIYSLGVVMYETLAGVKPFRGRVNDLIDQICNCPPARLSDFKNSAVDSELEAIVIRAMGKDVSSRYASAADFSGAISTWLEN